MRKIITLLFILATTNFLYSQPYFQKITIGQIVTDVNSSNNCSWADFDNDGDLDMVVSSFNDQSWPSVYPMLVYRNDGNGVFNRIYNIIASQITRSTSLAWGDYDNDGKLDLFVSVSFNENNMLFHNEGNGNFTKVTSGTIVNDGGESRAAAWADYDRDGWLDLFVCNQNDQNNFLYHNNGNGTFTKVTSGSIVNDGGWSRGCSWGDYDNDGWPDLFVVNYQGQNDFMYHNNHNGTFTRVYNGPHIADGLWGSGCSWGDYDNDGKLDLFVTNANQGCTLFHNDGGSFSTFPSAPSNDGGYGFCASWCDYDNDGWLDLVVCNLGSNNFLYKNINGTFFVKITNEIVGNDLGNSIGNSWGDYNNDGKMDLFISNTYSGSKNFLYKNNVSTGNYIICKLRGGCTSNKAAIGARIVVKDGNFYAMREVTAGFGVGSQDMLWQHFGLGNIANIDSIIVYWPSNRIQRLANIQANQTILIDECAIGIENNHIPVKYELKQNYPNPFNPTTTIEYSLLKSSNVRLTVFDINGKVIKVLVNKKQNAGAYEVNFDGADLASGLYIYKFETGEFNSVKKMILLK